jgi:hypothetical protein
MYFLNKVGRIKCGGMENEIENVVMIKIKKNGLPNIGRSK